MCYAETPLIVVFKTLAAEIDGHCACCDFFNRDRAALKPDLGPWQLVQGEPKQVIVIGLTFFGGWRSFLELQWLREIPDRATGGPVLRACSLPRRGRNNHQVCQENLAV